MMKGYFSSSSRKVLQSKLYSAARPKNSGFVRYWKPKVYIRFPPIENPTK